MGWGKYLKKETPPRSLETQPARGTPPGEIVGPVGLFNHHNQEA